MAETQPNLDGLLSLALDRSLASRERLAQEVGDICANEARVLTEQERDLIFEILKKLLHDFEIPLRARLSLRLAGVPNAPRELIVTLANDEIEVAQPVLLHSPVLRDVDLIEVIRHRSQRHQVAVARRNDLSETLSEVLVETHDEDVIQALLQNDNASISEATMAYLVEQSRRVDSFQEPLVDRNDLPEALAKKLYWCVAAALRQRILEKFDILPSQIDKAMEESVAELQADQAKTAETDSAAALARKMAGQAAISAGTLIKVLRRGEVALFEALFSEASGISAPMLQRIVYDSNGDRMAIVAKGLGFPRQAFATIFMLSRGSGKVMKPSELARSTRVFDRVSEESAKEIIASWQLDRGYQDAIEDLAADPATARARGQL